MTTTRTCARRAAGVLALLLAVAPAVAAQPLARRVERVRDGTVRMSFAARSEVCGNGAGNISIRSEGRRSDFGTSSRRGEWEDVCEHGPVRLALDVVDGAVIDVRAYVGGRWRASADAVDLGTVAVREAVDYLLDVVARGPGRAAGKAVFPTTLADSVVVWPRLIAIAKNDAHTRDARHQAIFWVGQAAGEKATEGLTAVIGDAAEDRDVREAAVFALSQRPRDEAVPALITIAKTARDPEIRKKAMFWLGNTKDRRAIEFFESILLKP